jgi:hypothetical protein
MQRRRVAHPHGKGARRHLRVGVAVAIHAAGGPTGGLARIVERPARCQGHPLRPGFGIREDHTAFLNVIGDQVAVGVGRAQTVAFQNLPSAFGRASAQFYPPAVSASISRLLSSMQN